MTLPSTVNEVLEKLTPVNIDILHHFSSGVYAKQLHVPAGHSVVQHKHSFDHMSILASGTVIVQTDEGQKEYTAPACIDIKKNKNHAIHAIEDSVWFCIHATDETDVEKVDEVLIKKDEE